MEGYRHERAPDKLRPLYQIGPVIWEAMTDAAHQNDRYRHWHGDPLVTARATDSTGLG